MGTGMDDEAAERRRALGRMVQAALLAGVPFGVAALSMVVRFVPPTWFTLMAAKITQVSGSIHPSHCYRRVSTSLHKPAQVQRDHFHACVAWQGAVCLVGLSHKVLQVQAVVSLWHHCPFPRECHGGYHECREACSAAATCNSICMQ